MTCYSFSCIVLSTSHKMTGAAEIAFSACFDRQVDPSPSFKVCTAITSVS